MAGQLGARVPWTPGDPYASRTPAAHPFIRLRTHVPMPTSDAPIEVGLPRPFLSGVVLAAGASTRMGRPKQLLPLGDRCLLERVMEEVAASRLDEIILVLGHRADEIRSRMRLSETGAPCRLVLNADHGRGQSWSLRLALDAADPRAVAAAILLGDQPGVTRALIDRVASAFLDAGLPAARPVYDGGGRGRVPGHPVFLARRLWRHVAALRGDEGARTLLASHPEWLLDVPIEGPAPADIDTPQDYEAYRDVQGHGHDEDDLRSAGGATTSTGGAGVRPGENGPGKRVDGGEAVE
jgi:molybdenum cofactor cytidylyltransferase